MTSSPLRLQPRLDLDLPLRARAQLARQLLARVAVGHELGVEHLDPGAHGGLRGLERRDEPLRRRAQRLVVGEPVALVPDPALTLGPLALGPLGEPPLGGQRRPRPGRAGGRRALVGGVAALGDEMARMALDLARLVTLARGGARRPVGLVARGVGGLDALARALDVGERGLLGLRGRLDLRDQRVAAVALGEHAVLAARGAPVAARARRATTRARRG